jgi:hypothetical protein
MPIRICETCKKEFHVPPSVIKQGQGKHCSQACRRNRKEIPCDNCGKVIIRHPSNKSKHTFCSKECHILYNRKYPQIGEQSSHWMGGITYHKRICKYCNKEFLTKHPDGNFCCKEHLHKWRSENLVGKDSPTYNRTSIPCNQCGKEISVTPFRIKNNKGGIFCSINCKNEYQSLHTGKEHPDFKSKFVNCIVCNKEFRLTPHWEKLGRTRYCSQECYWKDMPNRFSGENSPKWCGGNKVYCQKWNPDLLRRIRAFYNHTCVECGTPQNGTKLHCHHVYYNKKACCEVSADGIYYANLNLKNHPFDFEIIGDPDKFVALCDHCHKVTSGLKHREYWARHFETIINGYYEGKSYLTKEEYASIFGSSQTDHRSGD